MMRLAFKFLLFSLAMDALSMLPACPHPPPPIGPAPKPFTPVCALDGGTRALTNYDLCGEADSPWFTVDGLPCMQCGPGQMGCKRLPEGVYCVVGDCLLDGKCGRRP